MKGCESGWCLSSCAQVFGMVSPTGISIMMKINITEMINENINNDYVFIYLFVYHAVGATMGG